QERRADLLLRGFRREEGDQHLGPPLQEHRHANHDDRAQPGGLHGRAPDGRKATSPSARHCRNTVTPIMTIVLSPAAFTNVSRTRALLFAPKFWPAIGPAANAIAIAGRKIDCMMREPMTKPACAVAPKSLMTQ